MIERIGRVSDDLVRVGPFRFGWDGVLEFIPFVGEAYSLGAGAWLLAAGRRAHVPAATLAGAGALVGARTAIGAFDLVPLAGIAGDLIAGAFRGHRRAARLLLKSIDATHYVEGLRTVDLELQAEADRRRLGARRTVFLGEGPSVSPDPPRAIVPARAQPTAASRS